MTVLSIDFETRATVDLRATGVYPYAQHPDTDIWCMAWAFDDEEPEIWTPDMPELDRVFLHVKTGGEIRAWNAAFERIIWNEIMVKRYGAPRVKIEQWVCSAAEAAAMALPRSLDQCAAVTGVQQQKDQDGYQLMMRMTRPRSITKEGKVIWWEVEERKQRLFAYCKQDVRTERALTKVLRRLTPREREHYLETERANDRGIPLDRELVLAAKGVAQEGIDRTNTALCELTAGAVTEVTKVGQLKGWLNAQGVETNSVGKAAVRDLLASDLSPEVRRVLELRAEAGRSSIAKLDTLLECVCPDGRIRGMLLYHGASTGRWTGRLAQVHNFPRGEVDNIESYIPDILAGRYDFIDLLAHPVIVVSSLLRSCLTASKGHDLIAADYSAIEARVLNWLAGQDDIVALFAAGEDVYKHNAARLYNIPLSEVQKFPHRQTGKFQELGCGFGMGAKKAVSAAKDIYQLEITEDQAKEIVDGYRRTHSKVVDFWHEANTAALEAVGSPGAVVTFGALRNLKFTKQGAYLYLILPSRRPLVYAAPKIVDRPMPWNKADLRPAVECSAVNSITRQWSRHGYYGGLWVENIVQAVARDLMAEGTLRARDAGYPYLFTSHDEVVAEVPEGFGSLTEFQSLLTALPEWAVGCPVATEGWRGFRYRK